MDIIYKNKSNLENYSNKIQIASIIQVYTFNTIYITIESEALVLILISIIIFQKNCLILKYIKFIILQGYKILQ